MSGRTSTVVVRRIHDPAALSVARSPRTDLVREAPGEVVAGGLRFGLAEGPFRSYERTLTVDDPTAGSFTETIRYRLAIPFFGPLYAVPVRRALRSHPAPGQRLPWWSPPDRIDARTATVLGALAVVAVIAGYVNTLFTQTVSFAAREFGAGTGAQGLALAVVRVGVVIALAFAAFSDRRGRRLAILAAATLAPAVAALGALAPSLALLTLSQAVGRPMGLALIVLMGIVAAEEMPAGSRAYAVSILGMATALGAGLCVGALPLADLGTRGWRLVYLVPLVFWLLLPRLRALLPESRRFLAAHAGAAVVTARLRDHGRRFWLLAATGVLRNVLIAPASGFQNRYLADERGFSATMITVFTFATVTPTAVSLVVGGRLADVRGRRVLGAVGLLLSTLGLVLAFSSSGWQLWWWSLFAAVCGGVTVPALGVYDAELFPTGSRGKAGGWLMVLSLTGSTAGLVAAGWLIGALGSFGWTMAILAAGPVVAAVLVLRYFPETAGETLEQLNPSDRPPPRA